MSSLETPKPSRITVLWKMVKAKIRQRLVTGGELSVQTSQVTSLMSQREAEDSRKAEQSNRCHASCTHKKMIGQVSGALSQTG